MPVNASLLPSASALSAPLTVLAGAARAALVLLVGWAGLLYLRVLRLPERDRSHGLKVIRELTALVKAASEFVKPSARPDE